MQEYNQAQQLKLLALKQNKKSEEFFEIEKIIKVRKGFGKEEDSYLVKWKGYPDKYNTWETESGNLFGTLELAKFKYCRIKILLFFKITKEQKIRQELKKKKQQQRNQLKNLKSQIQRNDTQDDSQQYQSNIQQNVQIQNYQNFQTISNVTQIVNTNYQQFRLPLKQMGEYQQQNQEYYKNNQMQQQQMIDDDDKLDEESEFSETQLDQWINQNNEANNGNVQEIYEMQGNYFNPQNQKQELQDILIDHPIHQNQQQYGQNNFIPGDQNIQNFQQQPNIDAFQQPQQFEKYQNNVIQQQYFSQEQVQNFMKSDEEFAEYDEEEQDNDQKFICKQTPTNNIIILQKNKQVDQKQPVIVKQQTQIFIENEQKKQKKIKKVKAKKISISSKKQNQKKLKKKRQEANFVKQQAQIEALDKEIELRKQHIEQLNKLRQKSLQNNLNTINDQINKIQNDQTKNKISDDECEFSENENKNAHILPNKEQSKQQQHLMHINNNQISQQSQKIVTIQNNQQQNIYNQLHNYEIRQQKKVQQYEKSINSNTQQISHHINQNQSKFNQLQNKEQNKIPLQEQYWAHTHSLLKNYQYCSSRDQILKIKQIYYKWHKYKSLKELFNISTQCDDELIFQQQHFNNIHQQQQQKEFFDHFAISFCSLDNKTQIFNSKIPIQQQFSKNLIQKLNDFFSQNQKIQSKACSI